MLSKRVAELTLEAALSNGADFAELFVENKFSNSLSMVNGVCEKALSGVDYGCGIRIFNGLEAIYAYTNKLTEENLTKVAREAAQAMKGNHSLKPLAFMESKADENHFIRIRPDQISKQSVVELLHRASDAAKAFDPLITQTSGSYGDHIQDILIINSEGLWVTDTRIRSRIFFSAVASEANEKQTGHYGPGAMKGFELFDSIDMEKIGRDSAAIAVKMLKAGLCPSGTMPVVIDNGFGGVIFHEACGHSLEATHVAKKTSVFTDKLGQQIASSKVTAIDDGTIANEWGSINIDDEGTKTQRNVLIENGILKSYLIDRLNGKRMGMGSTGSSRRESYKFAPTSRMTNTYIDKGSDKASDIIGSIEYGLYAQKMGGGSVQPATGDFNFAVTEAHMIRNGKIAEPVRGASLIGKGSEVLLNIDMVSDNLSMDQGMCGSISGSVPTNVGQPMIRVSQMTVGGRK